MTWQTYNYSSGPTVRKRPERHAKPRIRTYYLAPTNHARPTKDAQRTLKQEPRNRLLGNAGCVETPRVEGRPTKLGFVTNR